MCSIQRNRANRINEKVRTLYCYLFPKLQLLKNNSEVESNYIPFQFFRKYLSPSYNMYLTPSRACKAQ